MIEVMINAMQLKKVLRIVKNNDIYLSVSNNAIAITDENITYYCQGSKSSNKNEEYTIKIIKDALLLPIEYIRSKKTEICFTSDNKDINVLIVDKNNVTLKLQGLSIAKKFFKKPQDHILIENCNDFYMMIQYMKDIERSNYIEMSNHGRLFMRDTGLQIDFMGPFESVLYYQKINSNKKMIRKEFDINKFYQLSNIIKELRPKEDLKLALDDDKLYLFNDEFSIYIDLVDSNEMLIKSIKESDMHPITIDNMDDIRNEINDAIMIKYQSRRLPLIINKGMYKILDRFILVQIKDENTMIQYIIAKKRAEK